MDSEEEIDIMNDFDVPLELKTETSSLPLSPLQRNIKSSTKLLPNNAKDKLLAKNRRPWTKTEKEMFFTGQSLFGKDWKQIADLIGTRSPAQVHSFAYYLAKSSKNKSAPANINSPIQEAIVKLQPAEDEEDLELCVDDEDNPSLAPSSSHHNSTLSPLRQFGNLQYATIWSKVQRIVPENGNVGPEEIRAALRAEFSTSQLSEEDVNLLIPLLRQDLARNKGCFLNSFFQENSRPKEKKIVIISNSPSQIPLKPERNGGYTLEHGIDGSVVRETKVLESKRKPTNTPGPFKLVSCLSYPKQAPLRVELSLGAALMITIHTYSMRTEVIGLLGGSAPSCGGKQQATATISGAFPCRSLSTGYQCEMDPVSQSEVSDQIHRGGGHVVGWYHSHPTFDPSPSLRDLETQASFQDLFSSQASSAFVAMISSRTGTELSTFHVVCNSAGEPVPYELPVTLVPFEEQESLLTEISSLCHQLKNDVDRLYLRPCPPDSSKPQYLCIQKLLDVLKNLIQEAGEDPDAHIPLLHPLLLKCRTCSSQEAMMSSHES